jgi:hypothetical protein
MICILNKLQKTYLALFTELQLGQTYSSSSSSLYSRKLCKSSGLFEEVASGEPEAAGR